jgi:hypothetical protein
MLGQLFPRKFDNTYRGYWPAIWLLVPIVVLRLIMGGNSMWHPHYVATSADGLPLESYTAAGAQVVVSMYAMMGVYLVLLALQSVLVMIRYRSMIPYVYLLLLLDQMGGALVNHLYPVVTTAASSQKAGMAVIYVILGLTFAGLVLSLVPREHKPGPLAAGAV